MCNYVLLPYGILFYTNYKLLSTLVLNNLLKSLSVLIKIKNKLQMTTSLKRNYIAKELAIEKQLNI